MCSPWRGREEGQAGTSAWAAAEPVHTEVERMGWHGMAWEGRGGESMGQEGTGWNWMRCSAAGLLTAGLLLSGRDQEQQVLRAVRTGAVLNGNQIKLVTKSI